MFPTQRALGVALLRWCHGRVKLDVVAGQKLTSAGVIVDTFPLHNSGKLKDLSEAWYSGNQLAQPLGGFKHDTTYTHTLTHDCLYSHTHMQKLTQMWPTCWEELEFSRVWQLLFCACDTTELTPDTSSAFSRFSQWVFWKLCGVLLQLPWFLHLVSAPTSHTGPVHHILLR